MQLGQSELSGLEAHQHETKHREKSTSILHLDEKMQLFKGALEAFQRDLE